MNKIFSAITLTCAMSPMALAQSSVSLYGIVDAGMVYSTMSGDYIQDKTNVGLAYGMQSGNRFGLKGREDLGSGTRATFQLEGGFNLGSGVLEQSATIFNRQSWVGIENDRYGYARLGLQYNFATDYFGAIDPFKLGFGQASMGAAFGSTNMYRMSNTIKYQSPEVSGFLFGVGYSFANGVTPFYYNQGLTPNAIGTTDYNFATANNNRQVTLGIRYAQGPLYLAASYDNVMGTNQPLNNSGSNPSAWNLGAAYDFNAFKLSLAYGQMRGGLIRGQGDGMTGPNEFYNPYWGGGRLGLIDFNNRITTSSYLIGASAPLSAAARIFASWTLVVDGSEITQANQTAYNIGYSYDFTKRTNIYALFSFMDNVNTTQSNKSSVLGVGLRHMF